MVSEKDVKRISKVPGLAEVLASAVIAEAADLRRFQDDKKINSWSGLALSTYQTAGKRKVWRHDEREISG